MDKLMGRRPRRGDAGVILTLFFSAFVAAAIVTAITGQFSAPQRWEYSEIAENIIRGRGGYLEYLGTNYYFYGPPVYPGLLAAVLWATNQREAAVLLLQAFLFACTCVAVYLIAASIFGKAEAILAALLAASHPGGLIYAGKLHSQTIDVFLIVFSFLLLARVTILSPLRALGVGLVTGFAVLCRGTVAPFVSLWAAWFLWKERRHLSRAAWIVVALAGGAGLVIAPILVRGYFLYGEVVPLRTDTGVNLWYGNHPGASGTSYTLAVPPTSVISRMPPELSARITGMNEVDQNKVFMAAALDFARNHPGATFVLFLKKLYYFWWFSPHSGLLYPVTWLTVYKIYYSVILFFAVIGLLIAMRSPRLSTRAGVSLFLLMAGSVSVTQALFYVEGRHRWQVEPLLLMYTAVGFLELLTKCILHEPPADEDASEGEEGFVDG